MRIQWRTDNARLLAVGHAPLYRYILFGERDWSSEDSWQGVNILVNVNGEFLLAPTPPDTPPDTPSPE